MLNLFASNSEHILSALDLSMAIIEFKPDGTIVKANKNFCDLMGYSEEIKTLITASGTHVASGVSLVSKAGEALQEIAGHVQEINEDIVAIVDAAREQSTALGEINEAINTVGQGTQKNAAMVEEQTAASHGLTEEAKSLFELLEQFRFDDAAQPRVTRRAA